MSLNDDDDDEEDDEEEETIASERMRDDDVATVAAVLGLEHDLARCRARLAACAWDVARAVDEGLRANATEANEDERTTMTTTRTTGVTTTRRRGAERRTRASANAGEGEANLRGGRATTTSRASFANPFRIISALGFGVIAAAVKISVRVVDAALRVVLPARTYQKVAPPLLRFARRFDSPATARLPRIDRDATSEDRAKQFAEWFNRTFYDANDRGLHFLHTSHRDALRFAQSEAKLLFVYLHSPSHTESELFCAQVLASSEVTTLVNERFIAWGGDVRDVEAYAVARGVRPSAYPYVCLLSSVAGEVSLVMSCEGFIDTTGLIATFEEALSSQRGSLHQARARNAEAQASRRLREEQDAALAESLAQDAARARERRAEADRVEAARAKAEAEARAIDEAKRREEEAERARADAIHRRRAEKAEKLRVEPGEGEGVSKLAIRLPDGSRAERRFYSTDTISDVYDFVDTLESLNEREYTLLTNFPRRMFARTDSVNLAEAGVHPNGALFVQTEKA